MTDHRQHQHTKAQQVTSEGREPVLTPTESVQPMDTAGPLTIGLFVAVMLILMAIIYAIAAAA